MEAIVLAGGFGSRLRQAVPDSPKAMAPVCGRPFLEILLAGLAAKGFGRVVLSLGYMAENILRHFDDRCAGMELVYEIEHAPLGTGGAVRRALNRCECDHAYILNGDTWLDLEAGEIEARWQSERVPLIIAAEVPDIARYGGLEIAGRRVTRFLEKGATGRGLANAGCYVFPPDIARNFPDVEAFSLERDFLPNAIARSPVHCFLSRGRFIDIGVPEDYARAQIELADIAGGGGAGS
jgi:D-glycero-alpha-D-manno-heptose 1-phosphate guanylyltransferase